MAAIFSYITMYAGMYNDSTGTIPRQDSPKSFFGKAYMLKFHNPRIPHKKIGGRHPFFRHFENAVHEK